MRQWSAYEPRPQQKLTAIACQTRWCARNTQQNIWFLSGTATQPHSKAFSIFSTWLFQYMTPSTWYLSEAFTLSSVGKAWEILSHNGCNVEHLHTASVLNTASYIDIALGKFPSRVLGRDITRRSFKMLCWVLPNFMSQVTRSPEFSYWSGKGLRTQATCHTWQKTSAQKH